MDLLSKFSRKISRIGDKTLLVSSSLTQCNVCAIASRDAEHCTRSPPQHVVASKYITAMYCPVFSRRGSPIVLRTPMVCSIFVEKTPGFAASQVPY